MSNNMRVPKGRVGRRWYVDAIAYASVSIAKGLRQQRRAAGLTQAEVARRAGIRPETLSRLEHGRGNPTVRTISRIVRAIGSGRQGAGSPKGHGGRR